MATIMLPSSRLASPTVMSCTMSPSSPLPGSQLQPPIGVRLGGGGTPAEEDAEETPRGNSHECNIPPNEGGAQGPANENLD
eukprot:306797-Alexandrium_andersonii.AAC.1